jgi:MoaA/NifB/PqqE/SkfB family radical SAM enzyme
MQDRAFRIDNDDYSSQNIGLHNKEPFLVAKQAVPGTLARQQIISGFHKSWIKFRMRARIMMIIIKNYTNPFQSFFILKQLLQLRRAILGKQSINKYANVNGKMYCDLYTPAIGTKAFRKFVETEAGRIKASRQKTNRFINVFISITKSCPLSCKHCFDWESLNRPDTLTNNDLAVIVSKVVSMGTSQIQITGGEPLTRMERVMEVLKLIPDDTEAWVLTSGYNLTAGNAAQLKNAGLTGVVVSLDHFNPHLHNQFRGSEKAFEWAKAAVENSISNHLVTALSLCATNSFITESNLMAYADLAREMGVSFIQVLEPKAAGHYKEKDVGLTSENQKLLEAFYNKMNYDSKYREYPIICYMEQVNRRRGCLSSGDRNLYLDTDGDIHACPFCRTKLGSMLSPDSPEIIENLRAEGCHTFGQFTVQNII